MCVAIAIATKLAIRWALAKKPSVSYSYKHRWIKLPIPNERNLLLGLLWKDLLGKGTIDGASVGGLCFQKCSFCSSVRPYCSKIVACERGLGKIDRTNCVRNEKQKRNQFFVANTPVLVLLQWGGEVTCIAEGFAFAEKNSDLFCKKNFCYYFALCDGTFGRQHYSYRNEEQDRQEWEQMLHRREPSCLFAIERQVLATTGPLVRTYRCSRLLHLLACLHHGRSWLQVSRQWNRGTGIDAVWCETIRSPQHLFIHQVSGVQRVIKRGDSPGHPRQGASKEWNYKN